MCTIFLSSIEMQKKCFGPKSFSRTEFRSSISSSTDSAISSGSFISSGSSIDVDLSSPGIQPEFREIEQSELAQILQKKFQINHFCSKKLENLLIFDCRNFADYNHCHIIQSINILYARMQRRRLLDNKLCCESLINQHLKTLNLAIDPEFPSLENCDVVIYAGDEKTSAFRSLKCQKFSFNCGFQKENMEKFDDCASSERCIRHFFDKLRNNSKLKCKRVMLLKGSFLDFRKQYPEFCESNEQSSIHNSSIETAPINVGFPSLMNCQTGTQKTGLLNHNNNNNNNPNISIDNNSSNNNAMTLVLNAIPPNRLSLPNSLSHPCLTTAPIFSNYHDEEEKLVGPTQILDFMFLGSQDDAMDPEVLKRHGISKIINLSETCPRPDSVPESMNHFLRIPIKDSYSAKLLPHFDVAYDFLETAKKNNEKVLVHCLAGISRSATLAIAYVMRSKGIPSDEAYKFVKAKRPSISPNFNFMGQLLEYEKQLRERQLLLPAGRPHSYAASHCEEPSTSNSALLNSPNNICKSVSSDFVLMATKREALKNENGKRTMDAPLTFPERPRQLMKTGEQFFPMRPGSIPLTPSTAPLKGELPSPSTEFEKLGISKFVNPIFTELPNLSESNVKTIDSAPATLCIENPLFNAIEKSKILPVGKKSSTNKFFQHHRFVKYLRSKRTKTPETISTPLNSASVIIPCSSRCVLINENRSGKIPAILGHRPFCRTFGKCRSGLQTVPDVPDDELLASTPLNSPVKNAKTGSRSAPPRSSISPIVRQRRSATVPTAIDIDESPQDPYRDPERESIGSAEIAVN